jgi:hypothetical protein
MEYRGRCCRERGLNLRYRGGAGDNRMDLRVFIRE